jgi:ribosomal protein S18 acetylase RimI-like enzyme
MRASDWEIARQLRLTALADTPDAFAATLEEESAMPEACWKDRAQSNAEGRESVGFFAVDGGSECGLAIGIWVGGEPPTAQLNALWIAPGARRAGAGRVLVAAVADWARERGAARLVLEVTETSQAALALYRVLGFEVVRGPAPICGRRQASAIHMQRLITS